MDKRLILVMLFAAVGMFVMANWSCGREEVVRPEEIRSKRLVVYDQEKYQELARLWEKYNKAYPSEFAYGNWVYAERYAGHDFIPLVKRGLKKYPDNPLLLYLASMENQGKPEDRQALEYLERAVAIDPNFLDPWFSLVTIYMSFGDDEKVNLALRKILESGYVHDDIYDYNYNVLIGLEQNAVLISNGDNDTYPVWILQRILNVRPDVTLANMSLLNTKWYPVYLVEHGAPQFVTASEVEAIRDSSDQALAARTEKTPVWNPYSYPLITKMIGAAERERRPVYFAHTVYEDEFIKSYKEQGCLLGLATLVTPCGDDKNKRLEDAMRIWVNQFRTGGMDSWRLRSTKPTDAGRMLMPNYAFVAAVSAAKLKGASPELRGALFKWYRAHVEPILNEDMKKKVCQVWCEIEDVPEISEWCKVQDCRM
ncbi:MAG: hypothetical protein KDB65_00190 [Calditrichaeota bacterium]|nr:hypothetical protein [Calditrichota bacterium]MCB9368555.1 hypothetical protein [Calditrichota bacterium]